MKQTITQTDLAGLRPERDGALLLEHGVARQPRLVLLVLVVLVLVALLPHRDAAQHLLVVLHRRHRLHRVRADLVAAQVRGRRGHALRRGGNAHRDAEGAPWQQRAE